MWAHGLKGEKLRRGGIPPLAGGLRGARARSLWKVACSITYSRVPISAYSTRSSLEALSDDWRECCGLCWNNEFFVAMENISRNEGPSCSLSGYGESMEHIQRKVRSELLNLPGAVHMNFIFLPEDLEVTFLKETISWVSRELSENSGHHEI